MSVEACFILSGCRDKEGWSRGFLEGEEEPQRVLVACQRLLWVAVEGAWKLGTLAATLQQ